MTDDSIDPPSAPSPSEDFPSEEEWLRLPAPEISAGFVERAWQKVRAERAADDRVIAAWLAAYRVPEPSPEFVEGTLRRIRAPIWQRLASGPPVPEPSPDFVDRVLRALQQARPAPQRPRARAGTWIAAAAAALLLVALPWALLVPRDARAPSHLPFEVLPAQVFTPDPWATALSTLSERGLGLRVVDRSLRLAQFAGLEHAR